MPLQNLFAIFLTLTVLSGCRQIGVCTDPTAYNAVFGDLDPGYVSNNRYCKYGPSAKFTGQFSYTDTFTYYPLAGGLPQNRYVQGFVWIRPNSATGNGVSISNISSTTGTVSGDSLICRDGHVFVLIQSNPIILSLSPDGLSNTNMAYLK
jgi:hypothetical protein